MRQKNIEPKKRGDLQRLIDHLRPYTLLTDEGIRKILKRKGEPSNPIVAKAWRIGVQKFPGFEKSGK